MQFSRASFIGLEGSLWKGGNVVSSVEMSGCLLICIDERMGNEHLFSHSFSVAARLQLGRAARSAGYNVVDPSHRIVIGACRMRKHVSRYAISWLLG